MHFRMKFKHWAPKDLNAETYDPEEWVRPGCRGWKLRIELNKLFKAGRMAEYKAAKAELFKSAAMKKKTPPTILSLDLKHGDMVVMHGEEIQKINEVNHSSHEHPTKLTSFSILCSRRESCGMDSPAGT